MGLPSLRDRRAGRRELSLFRIGLCENKNPTAGTVSTSRRTILIIPAFEHSNAEQYLSQQRQNVLRVLVGQRQHVGTGLNQNLSPCQRGRFRSEVSVTNRALGFLQVGDRVIE